MADRMICQSVRAVTTVATQPGLIRIGMDDLVTALKNADSRCLFGFGQAKGEARAAEALQAALKSPLLDRGQLLEKARNVLVHICGGTSLTLFEIETLMKELSKHVSEEAQILFGAASDAKLGDTLSVTIISSLGKGRSVPAAEPVAQSVRWGRSGRYTGCSFPGSNPDTNRSDFIRSAPSGTAKSASQHGRACSGYRYH